MSIALFLQMSGGFAAQAGDGPLRWEASAPATTTDDDNRVTLTYTLVGGDNVVGAIENVGFTLFSPVGGWEVVSSTGFTMPPTGAPMNFGPPTNYFVMANIFGPSAGGSPIATPHVVTITIEFDDPEDLDGGILFDITSVFEHGGPNIIQPPGDPGAVVAVYGEPTLVGIAPIAPVDEIPFGVARSAPAAITAARTLGNYLPGQVELITSVGPVMANVTWNIAALTPEDYTPANHVVQTFIVNGTATLPAEIANPHEISLSVQVQASVDGGRKADIPWTAERPTIEDGPVWDNAAVLEIGERVRRNNNHARDEDGNFQPTATAVARVLWGDENLYVRVEVTDANRVLGSDHECDGVEVFLGEHGLTRMGMTGAANAAGWQNQYRLTATGAVSFRFTTPTTSLISTDAWRRVVDNREEGYTVFLAIPLRHDYGPVTGKQMLFDIMLNDGTMPHNGRTAEVSWSDGAHNGFSNSNGWGQITLVRDGAPRNSIVATAGHNGSISPSSVPGRVWVNTGQNMTFNFIPAFGFEVDTVTVNGVDVANPGTSYTFTNVTTDDNRIHVTFRPDPAAVELPFIVWNDNFASGEFTTAVIIDLGEGREALGSALNPAMFSVDGEDRRAYGSTAVTFAGPRNITRVYANDTPTVRGYLGFNTNSPDFQEGLASGRFIVIELEFWTEGGGQTTLSDSNSTNQFYRVSPNAGIPLVGGESIDLMFFTQSEVVNPLIDKFVRVPTPANGALYLHRDAEGNVVQNLPMFVYVHGMGRGGGQAVNDFTASLKSPNGAMALMSRMHDPVANADGKFDSHVFAVAYGGTGGGFSQVNVVNQIRSMITAGYVNPDRVFVSGFSMGGSHTHTLMNNNPGFFAAAAPLAPVGGYPGVGNAAGNANIAYWALVNRNDAAMYQTGITNWRNNVLVPIERMHNARASRFETNPVLVWPENQSTVIHAPHELEAAVYYNLFKDVNIDGTPWDLVPVAQSARFGPLPVDVFQRTTDPEVLAAWAAHVAQWDDYPDLLTWFFSQCKCDVCDICHPSTHNVPYTAVRPTIADSAIWDNALTLSLGEHTRRAVTHPESMPTATGEAQLLWDDENLYVRVMVNDSTPFTDGDAHTVDGAEIFLGETGVRRAMTGQNPVWQNQYRLARSAQFSSRWITTTTALIGREDWRRQVINNGEDGYIVFIAIPLKYNNGPVTNQMMLFDVMLNDANYDRATRTAEISIFDAAHNGFSNSNGWGEIYLRGGPTNRQAIAVSYGGGGAITPSSANANVWVQNGANQTFAITPALGYVVDSVLVNGESVGAVASYTFENVTAPGSIHATFRRAENATEFPFIVYNDVFADGEFTTALIIDLGENRTVNTADLDPSMFTVSARNTGLNGVLAFAGTRNITRVYANTVQDVIGYITPMPGFNADAPVPASGRFIVIEMEFFSPAGGLAHGGLTRNGAASMILNYSILANAPLTLAGGETISVLGFNQYAVVSPVLDQFVEGRFIPETGAQIPYTIFINPEAEGPLPLFIYLHGGGRGPDLWAPLRSANGAAMAATPYHQARNPMHVLSPQGTLFAGTGADTATHLLNRDNMVALVQGYAAKGLVDMNRIYISGFSMGGMGTMGFVRTHPEFVAAAVPIGGGTPPTAELMDANPAVSQVSLWKFRHRGEAAVQNTIDWMNYFVENGPGEGRWPNGNVTILNSNAAHGFPYFGYGWTAHESEAAVFGNKIGDIAPYFAFGPGQVPYQYKYIFDWMNSQSKAAYTLTFHLYTENPTILDAFEDYTTVVDGSAVIVVPVVPGSAPALGDVLNLGHIYGTAAAHGYAFWGWFDGATLGASGRERAGLRRPALTKEGVHACPLADLLASVEDETAVFVDGNIDLYGVWVRWGDVDDNGIVNMADLNLLQRFVNFGHVMDVYFSGAAADVVVDDNINMADLNLLQRHINLGHLIQIVLGEAPQP